MNSVGYFIGDVLLQRKVPPCRTASSMSDRRMDTYSPTLEKNCRFTCLDPRRTLDDKNNTAIFKIMGGDRSSSR